MQDPDLSPPAASPPAGSPPAGSPPAGPPHHHRSLLVRYAAILSSYNVFVEQANIA